MPGRRWSRRPAPGGRGQGGGQDREREPDPGHHLLPELLPHVLEALGHDRHRRHRGRGVRQDLQPRRPRRPHQPPHGPQGHRGRGLQDRAREVRGGRARRSRSCNEKGQPVLVGTVSIAKSEVVSTFLKKQGVPHNVLNAKQHQREAEIVAQAGRKGAVTISTNMAGRGTDILLGGNPEVLARAEVGAPPEPPPPVDGEPPDPVVHRAAVADWEKRLREGAGEVPGADRARAARRWSALGGLFILGTERHESRRIDNQLRGRAGRQGDPGVSQVLPVARRRPDAHLRVGAHLRPDGAHGDAGGRGHRAPLAHQGHRERPEAGRGPQLRHPQEPARVRRRDEPAAAHHLQAAPPGAGRGRGRGAGRVRRGQEDQGEDPQRADRHLGRLPGDAPRRARGRGASPSPTPGRRPRTPTPGTSRR